MGTSNTNRRDYEHHFKLLIIGDSAVGKSSLLLRFADNTFSHNYVTTVGVDFKVRTITIDNERVKLQIWDTAGQERFRTITSTYYRGTHGVLIVFDLTNEDTFSNVKRWLGEIDQNCDLVQRVLVGNKCDEKSSRVITESEARQYAARMNVPYFETSAKENINVEEMFNYLTNLVLSQKKAYINQTSDGPSPSQRSGHGANKIKLTNNHKKRRNKKKSCC